MLGVSKEADLKCNNNQKNSLTCRQLQPCTYFIDGGCITEPEERETADAGPHHGERNAHQDSGRLERRQRRQGAKRPPAFRVGPIRVQADLKKAQGPGQWGRTPASVVQFSCAHPGRLDENDHFDNSEAESADGPQHSHRPGTPDKLRLIQTGHFGGVMQHSAAGEKKQSVLVTHSILSSNNIYSVIWFHC